MGEKNKTKLLPSRKSWVNCRSQQDWQSICLSTTERPNTAYFTEDHYPCCSWIIGMTWRPSEATLQSIYRGNPFAHFCSCSYIKKWSRKRKPQAAKPKTHKQQNPKLTISKNKSETNKILTQQEQQQLSLPHIYPHWISSPMYVLCLWERDGDLPDYNSKL